MHFSYFRTLSFDDSNPCAARKGREPLNPINKDSLQKSLLDPEDSRRRSWHSEEISTYFLDVGISSKGRITHVAPIVIITIPVIQVKPLPISPHRHWPAIHTLYTQDYEGKKTKHCQKKFQVRQFTYSMKKNNEKERFCAFKKLF